MGTRKPKPEEGPGGDGLTDAQRELLELEDFVKDAIVTRMCEDKMLATVLDIATASITEGRPLYASVLDEPIFYRRYIKHWIEEGLKEALEIAKATKQTS